jgi:uncharacterized protein YndB with AHSA1/START domain
MTMQSTAADVRTSVVVNAPIERAFSVFTNDMAAWWPEGHSLLEGEVAETVFEPFAGGRVGDRGVDGSECWWARVLSFEPPERFTISWDIRTDWKLETDPQRCSEVEVSFVAEAADRTRVELEHRHLDRHGEGWEGFRDQVGAPTGWPHLLELYAAHAAG